MKTARVVPFYKKSSRSEPGNYRPVSTGLEIRPFLQSGTAKICAGMVNVMHECCNKVIIKKQSVYKGQFKPNN